MRPLLHRRLYRASQVVAHLLLGLIIVYLPAWRGPRRSALARWWARRLCRILHVRVHAEGVVPAASSLFVANHISWLDIVCLLSQVPGVFVAKSEVAAWPMLGHLARRAGTLFIARQSRGAARQIADQVTWLLARGTGVTIFPEGTSTDGAHVGRFYPALFQSATRTRAPVQPVAIAYPADYRGVVPFVGEAPFLAHLWHLLGESRIGARLVFCPPVLVPQGAHRQELSERAWASIVDALGLDERGDRLPGGGRRKIAGKVNYLT